MARSAGCRRDGLVTRCLPSLFKHARAQHPLRDTPDNSSSAIDDTVEPEHSVQGSIWPPGGLHARSYLTSDIRGSLREIMRTRPLDVNIIPIVSWYMCSVVIWHCSELNGRIELTSRTAKRGRS